MTSRPMLPITISALQHLRIHSTSSIAQLKTTLPSLTSKTMSNLVQLGHALHTEAGYQITGKGKARLQKSNQAEQPEAPATKAPEAQAGHLSNAETEQRIQATLRRASTSLTLQDISTRTGLALNLLRPSLTTLVQGGSVIGTSSKPSRYRLRPVAVHVGASVAERRRLQANSTSGLYQGQELHRNPGIGAERFTAFALPSRVGTRLFWPDGRVTHISEHPGLPA